MGSEEEVEIMEGLLEERVLREGFEEGVPEDEVRVREERESEEGVGGVREVGGGGDEVEGE